MYKKKRYKFKNQFQHRKINYKWITTIAVVTFFIAMILSYFSIVFMEKVSLVFAVFLLLIIVATGIFFDLLGIAVTAATEQPFHSMASANVKGAKESILIIRNAGSVANFFNDVIGDIAGIVSGSATSAILLKIMIENQWLLDFIGVFLAGLIAAVTVGGKAYGKEIALRQSNHIVYRLGYLLSLLKRS